PAVDGALDDTGPARAVRAAVAFGLVGARVGAGFALPVDQALGLGLFLLDARSRGGVRRGWRTGACGDRTPALRPSALRGAEETLLREVAERLRDRVLALRFGPVQSVAAARIVAEDGARQRVDLALGVGHAHVGVGRAVSGAAAVALGTVLRALRALEPG